MLKAAQEKGPDKKNETWRNNKERKNKLLKRREEMQFF
jgi:hypothetical protein